jgi:hypothetical protein
VPFLTPAIMPGRCRFRWNDGSGGLVISPGGVCTLENSKGRSEKLERHFSSAVNVAVATFQFAEVTTGFTALIGPKHAEFGPESWNLWGILCAAKPMPQLAGRPEFDENDVFKS